MSDTHEKSTDKTEAERKPTWTTTTKSVHKENHLGSLAYRTVCGEIAVDSPTGESEKKDTGKVFYTAYFVDEIRPITFFFNGGPGAASMWLHLGGFGPKRVNNLDVAGEGAQLVDHPETMLHQSDLVFVDPIGTGFSSNKDGLLADFCSETGDATYLAQFISRFLGLHKLWRRPVYLCGESYGGYRVSLLSHVLITKYDLAPAGLIFVAPFLSGASGEESEPNIISEANFLTGYILSAWFHQRSSLNATCTDPATVYREARNFSYREFLPARLDSHPHLLSPTVLAKLAALSGISRATLVKSGLNIASFCGNLFPDEKRYPGRLDSRYLLEHPYTSVPIYLDPSLVTLSRKISPLMNDYLLAEMGWESAQHYVGLGNVWTVWRFHEPFYSSAFSALRASLKLNPKMTVYAAGGYYDLAVPLAGVEYDLMQVADTDHLKERIRVEAFTAGHMMYVKDSCRQQMLASIKTIFVGGVR